MGLEWISNLRLKENLGKILTVASMVATLGYIVFWPRNPSPEEKKGEVENVTKDADLDLLSQKRTRKTFLSEDEENEDNYKVHTLNKICKKNKALGNTHFMSDNELIMKRMKKVKVQSFSDDQQLDRFHFAVGKSLNNSGHLF